MLTISRLAPRVAQGVFGGVVLLASACGSISLPGGTPGGGNVSAAGGLQGAAKVAELQKKAAQCDDLQKMEVAIEEENAIGGAVAVKWVQEAGGVMIDKPAGKQASELRDRKTVQVPAGANKDLAQYIDKVGKNLAAQSARPTLDWTFGVLKSPGVNAFSTPGGYVLVTVGLLKHVENEAQLAFVLGHEIGHITEKHALNAYKREKVATCHKALAFAIAEASGATSAAQSAAADVLRPIASSFGGLLGGSGNGFLDLNGAANIAALTALTDDVATGIANAGFGAEDEYNADRIGLDLAIGAGYSATEYAHLLHKLPKGDGMLAKHPSNDDRVKHLEEWFKSIKPNGKTFGYADYPFAHYPKVTLAKEFDAVKKAK